MQEFGQSILDNLWDIMQGRSKLFNELIKEGKNIKDITDYRKMTGKKMARIIVILDEFQMLFSEEHNRKVAAYCGGKFADFISLSRVYGIHFIMATQTMSRLSSGFSIRKATINEMYVRIGLKCTENESTSLFGEANGRVAFGKMGTEKGSAVYSGDYVQGTPVAFKAAFCDSNTQDELLNEIEQRFSLLEPNEKTKIFIGDSVPNISECKEFLNPDNKEALSSVPIYLGEPIKIAPPIRINVNRKKRSNLLIVGSNQEMNDRMIAIYMMNALKSKPSRLIEAQETSVYLLDGLTVLGENKGEYVDLVNHGNGWDIKVAADNFEVVQFIDDIYSIYEYRRELKMKSGSRPLFNTVHLVINNLQWIEALNLMFANKKVTEFVVTKTEDKASKKNADTLFGYLDDDNGALGLMDEFLNELNISKKVLNSNVSHAKKIMTIIETGYTYGVNVVMSCPDILSIKEYMYDIIPKFSNRIVFSLSNHDADRIVQEAKTEQLKSNIVIFYDGVNPSCQFKPYLGIAEYYRNLLTIS